MDRTHIYIEKVKAITGKTPADFKKLAEKKGLIFGGELLPTVNAGDVLSWLKEEFELGHGHAMAIYHTIKGK